jgi:hypothetical protein
MGSGLSSVAAMRGGHARAPRVEAVAAPDLVSPARAIPAETTRFSESANLVTTASVGRQTLLAESVAVGARPESSGASIAPTTRRVQTIDTLFSGVIESFGTGG